jgi:RNA recognition motif-containing protein
MHSTIRLWRSLRPLNNSNTLNTATQHVRQVSNASIFSALNKLSVKEDPNANHNGPVNITKARPNPNVFLNNLPHDIRAEDLKKYLPGSVTKIQLRASSRSAVTE